MIDTIRNKLEDIEELEPKEKVGIYLAIATVLVSIFYFLFLSSALDEFNENQEQINSLKEKLKKPTYTLALQKIARLKKEVMKNKTEIDEAKSQLIFFQHKLNSERFLFISQNSTSIFLDKLLDNSLKKGVLIQAITLRNENEPYVGNLKLKKVIDINASGRFLNNLSFLRTIEESPMLLKVENLHIFLQEADTLHFSFEVKFYGVKK